jgi:hypothetical protein
VQTLNAGLNQRQSKVNAIAEVDNAVKGLGETAFVDSKTGKYTLSPMIRSSYQTKIKPNIVKAILSDNRKVASILADNVGGFTFTMDKKEAAADSSKILLVADENGIMQPQINSEKQRKIAEEYIGNMIDSRVDFKQAAPEAPQQRQQEKMSQWEFDYMKGQNAAQERAEKLQRTLNTGYTGKPGDIGAMIVNRVLPKETIQGLGDYTIMGYKPAPKDKTKIEILVRRERAPGEDEFKKPEKRLITRESFLTIANEIINRSPGVAQVSSEDVLGLSKGKSLDYSAF